MPHVTFVPLTGFRVREAELRELGMSLPGLSARGQAVGQLPALGLLTLAGMLPADWSCTYRPTAVCDEAAVELILSDCPALVAISALTASIEEAYVLSRRLQKAGIQTVIGGLHATALPEEAVNHSSAVVVGSGEHVWLEVLSDAAKKALKPIYRASRTGPPSWPSPRFDLLGDAPPRYTLQTQRGCPLACDFCGASRLLGSFQEKPIAAIRAELTALNSLNVRPLVELADDNTFAGARAPQELFDALRAARVRYFTECDWRIGERPEVLSGLAQSGCVQVLVGIESLVLRYPGMGAKRTELSRVMDAVVRIQEAGVPVNGCFIIGADGETPHSIERLVQFILDSPLAEVQLTLQTPFPGAVLHRRLQQQGRLLADRGWSHYTLFDVTYQPDQMTVAELELGFRNALAAIFAQGPTERRFAIRKSIMRRRIEDCT